MSDRENVREFLEADPVGNAIVWDRAFQQGGYEVLADRLPPRAVMAVHRTERPQGANFIALAAESSDAAGVLLESVPTGFTIIHLTEEFPLPLVERHAIEFHPQPAWLFELRPGELIDQPDPRVRPLDPSAAARVAKLWQPEWPAEGYVVRRIEDGPTAAIYTGDEPIAWALTHTVTDRVGIIGMVHVVDAYRRKGLARAVVAAVARELERLGKRPALHAFVDNVASLALFPTLGFRRVKRQVWGDVVFR
ncbi:MAG TPA: GNAT family N-acetyltransferase [Thermoplasmata archaeon]|nr:GNAT family N-acetyltransferase [Thermoplasmata archaeon]